ncbi:Cytosolic copper metallochaperone [Naganishia albida]|nr:Cytosolic copper metallochaperone [Naganishia albida]
MTSNFIGASANLAPASGPTTTTQVPATTTAAAAAPGGAKVPPKPYYYFNVKMTCSGCSGAIDRVLKKNIAPPNEYSVSLEDQTAYVWGPDLPKFDDVRAKIAKTGKEILDAEPFEE